ncbi:MarR family winged helix-turn-helix transcriptional regulator [Microbacterium fluvii]|uniref:MarR family winged helix-turn-helix transcriptional regulator n=1 Tax=Microbacterium fluvii TaxID=415215 RepID=A0ABW2HAR0_9MICO|nr:MarR family transcriptional regulator [Microbacterium fluvii]MCU4671167.1 MarR family transcriptional regulator [Microbacterium fluvii]
MTSRRDPAHRSLPLLAQLGNTVVRELKDVMSSTGLHPRQSAILSYLDESEHGASQQTLSDLIAVHRSAMVLLIDDLESKGYVRRARNGADRRAYDVVITAEGRAALHAIEPLTQAYEDELLGALSTDEREHLLGLLIRVAESRSIGVTQKS